MNPNKPTPPNSQNSNPQIPFPYPYPNPYFTNPQNFNSPPPNSQYQFPHPQNSQFPFSYSQNSPHYFPFPPYSNSQFETQQPPNNTQNSPDSQVPAFGNTNFVDLNDDCVEVEDVRESIGQWKWVEDKLLISAWLNESIDPLIGTDQKAEIFWERIKEYCEEDNPGVIKRGVVAMRKRYPKWRTPTTSASSKRTKLSSSGAYSSEGNNETPTSDEFELVSRPQGTKTAKRKGKGKATTAEIEEYEAIQVNDLRKMKIMETINEMKQKKIETRQKKIETKQTELDLQVILADTTKMNEAQRRIHATMLEKIRARN
ncbi:uncharacterized protein LOC141659676 [Apium graveolens]|uniref:uncharacterized protein LOC141659676 n=1 Tax=Apium graveolens TaxID=4045 RepID=UPI003D7A9E93